MAENNKYKKQILSTGCFLSHLKLETNMMADPEDFVMDVLFLVFPLCTPILLLAVSDVGEPAQVKRCNE